MLLSGPQLINMLASSVSSGLQAINFQLVFSQRSQPLDAYNSSLSEVPQMNTASPHCLPPMTVSK